MWNIPDLEKKYWRETMVMPIGVLIMTMTLGITSLIWLNYPSVWVVVIGFLVCASVVAFVLEMRYRMHRGTYGRRGYEYRGFNRWLRRNGAKRVDGMNLS